MIRKTKKCYPLTHKPIFLFHEKEHRRLIAYNKLIQQYPGLIHHLLEDLLAIEGYSEIEIGFGAGISLDIIRHLAHHQLKTIPATVFFNLLALYARVFCDWNHYNKDIT